MISIKFEPSTRPGCLARAEIHFVDGELQGLRLIGFTVWSDRLVTYPGAMFTKHGRHGRWYLRPISETASPTLSQEILDAYDEFASASGLTA